MDEERPPYSSYAAIAAAFVGGLTVSSALARALGRDTRELTALDFATLAAATFKASRTISHDKVTSFVREPFVEGALAFGAAAAVRHNPAGGAEQPRPRLRRQLAQLAPGDHEDVGDDLVGLIWSDPSPDVGADRAGMLQVQALEL